LPLRAAFAEHEHQSADDDGDERKGPGDRPCEREREVACGPLPGRLRKHDGRQEEHGGCRDAHAPDEWKESAVHVNLHATRYGLCYHTSICMASTARSDPDPALAVDLARALGVRRSTRLRAVVRHTGLP